MAAIIEQGGEDPQIPPDVNEGCGTHPTGAQDEAADSANRADSKSLSLEVRGGAGWEDVEGAVAVEAAAGDPGGIGAPDGGAAAAAARAKTAERGADRSPSTAGFASNGGGTIAVRTDGDDCAVAGAGGCARCGARVPCACGGARGGGGAGGATGGGGNTTPGRRFGSPQQSKGLRNVMSWAPGGSVSASAAKGRGRGSGVGDDGGDRRRGRSSGHEEHATEWNPSSSGGSVGSFSSEESFSQKERRKSGGGERCAADGARHFRLSGDGGARKRRRDTGLRKSQGEDGIGSTTDQGADSGGSKDNGATAPERPKSPRSPRSHSSTRLKRVSGGGSSRGNGSIDGDDSEGERTTVATALTISNRDPSPRRESSDNGNRTADGEEEEGGREHRLARIQPSRIGNDAASSNKPKPSTGFTEASRQKPEDPAASSRQETSADNGQPTASPSVPTTSSTRPEVEAPGGGGAQLRDGNAENPRRSSSAAATVTAAGGAGGALILDHLAATPRTPRSPRLVGSGSETFKTAKRLSEALTFAASGSEGGLLTNATSSAASRVGLTPRRESTALGGALAVVEEAAAEANGTHRGEPLGGRQPQPADVRDAAAVVVPPSPVGSGDVP